MTPLSVRFTKSQALPLVNSLGKKHNRVVLTGLHDDEKKYHFSLKTNKLFNENALGSMKENCWNRFLRSMGLRKWVVLRVANGNQEGFLKVNAESLRKRLGIEAKEFKTLLKHSIDFTDTVLSKISPSSVSSSPTETTSDLVPPLDEVKIERYLNHPERFPELSRIVDENWIKNTGLTWILAGNAFMNISTPIPENLNILLDQLVAAALNNHQEALVALTLPNNPGEVIVDKDWSLSGMPQNTPLCLLVKMGNLIGVKKVLQVYDERSLLAVTPRGNTPLHLAIITGQWDMAVAIMKRADQLNVLDRLLALKNVAGKTADDMFQLLTTRDSKINFKVFLDVVDPFLGGEEVNKARMGGIRTSFLDIRNRLFAEIDRKKIFGSLKDEYLMISKKSAQVQQ